MGVCVVCGTRTGKKSGKSFHKFPFNKNPTVAEKWVNWVRKVKRSCWTPCKTSIICSDHFAVSAFDRSTFRVELNTNSVPTIFLSDNNIVTDKNSVPEIPGGKQKSAVNKTNLESQSNKRREDNVGIVSEPSAPEILSTPEVLAVKRKTPMHEICTDNPLKKHCGNSSTIISASVTDNCIPDSTALAIYSTPAKFPPDKALDESDVTPKSSIACPADECRTGRRRLLLFHDHNYENTPGTYKKKNHELKENLNKVRTINKAQRMKIKKLKKQVESLKDLVGTLRKEGRVCTEGYLLT